MQDIGEAQVERGLNTIAGSLERLIKKEKISAADKEATLVNIETTTSLEELADVDIVIEAATENEALKLDIFAQLDKLCKPEAILASNTSSISLTKIAGATARADQVYQAVHQLSEAIGKVPIEAKDSPGFVANRILIPMINEAAYVYYEGLASAEGIDEIMKLGMAHPMGPLMLADLIGLDTCYAVIKVLHEGFGDSKYRPCPIWQQMVDAGYLGRKTGRGFYSYDA
jgi:3-hydroxybutyryl-CoA dehydrogenase